MSGAAATLLESIGAVVPGRVMPGASVVAAALEGAVLSAGRRVGDGVRRRVRLGDGIRRGAGLTAGRGLGAGGAGGTDMTHMTVWVCLLEPKWLRTSPKQAPLEQCMISRGGANDQTRGGA
jgi:hypothetical protein